jgi:hypothetical protein
MPVGLVVFGDKSHTDLHGALSLTPIIFTLTLFDRAARNDSKFWRPIGYISNLGYRRGTSNKTHTRDKIQDEHSCISFAFQSLKNINKKLDSNGLSWDIQCMSKFGYIVLLEIPKETTNGWVNILGIERV